MIGQLVSGPQQHLHDVVIRLEGSRTNLVQYRLENMGEADEHLETEGAAAALDGMHGAEHGVDDFAVRLAVLHRDESFFHGEKKFVTFLEIRLFDGFHRIHDVHPMERRDGSRRAVYRD